MRPYDAKSTDDVCDRLRRDHKDVGDFWILTDGYRVTISEQKWGEKPKQSVTVSRDQFNRLIDWYLKDQKALAAPSEIGR